MSNLVCKLSMAENMSMMGSRREERLSMPVFVLGDEEVNLAVGKSLASEDYYQQHGRVWKFRSENLDEEEFEVAAAGSGWRDEEDCDNFQRYFPSICSQLKNKQTNNRL